MKRRRIGLSLSAVLIMASCSVGRADDLPPTYIIDNFNDASSINAWCQWFSYVPLTFSYDATVDAGGGGAGSGSMKVSADFSDKLSEEQFGIGRFLSGHPFDPSVTIPVTAYAYLSMDIRWDPNSTLDGDGTFGSIIIHSWDGSLHLADTQSIVSTPAGNTGWVHVLVPIPQSDSWSDLSGFGITMWEGQSSGPFSIQGPVTFWLDNIELTNVPEPSSLALLFGGGLFLGLFRR